MINSTFTAGGLSSPLFVVLYGMSLEEMSDEELVKKAILITLSKLPRATGKAFTLSNTQKRFVLNDQLDIDSKIAPCMMNIMHTYQGNITTTSLKDPK